MRIYQNSKDSVLVDLGSGSVKVHKGEVVEVEEQRALKLINEGLFVELKSGKPKELKKEKKVSKNTKSYRRKN